MASPVRSGRFQPGGVRTHSCARKKRGIRTHRFKVTASITRRSAFAFNHFATFFRAGRPCHSCAFTLSYPVPFVKDGGFHFGRSESGSSRMVGAESDPVRVGSDSAGRSRASSLESGFSVTRNSLQLHLSPRRASPCGLRRPRGRRASGSVAGSRLARYLRREQSPRLTQVHRPTFSGRHRGFPACALPPARLRLAVSTARDGERNATCPVACGVGQRGPMSVS